MPKFEISLDLPDKEPFEGKATQKQKQFIWDLGYQDEEAIAALGKKQASAVIDQLKKVKSRGEKIIFGTIQASVCAIILIFCLFNWSNGLSQLVGWLCIIGVVHGLLRIGWNKLLLPRAK